MDAGILWHVESILLPKEGHLSVFEVAERQNTACEIARLEVQWNFSQNGVTTLSKTNNLHLAGGRAPKGNSSFNSSVSGCYVSFKEGRCSCEMSKKQNRINGSSNKGLRTCTELASGEMIMKSSGMKVLTSD